MQRVVTKLLLAMFAASGAAAAVPIVTGVTPNTGSVLGGQVITITGSNFNNPAVSSVNIAAAGTLVIVSDTKITITTAAGAAGAISVNVTNGSGTNAVNALYTYVADNPTIQVVAQVTLPKHAGIQWADGTSKDDNNVDHTVGTDRISPYLWVIKDSVGGTNLDCNSVYLTSDAANNKTIKIGNQSNSNSTLTINAVVTRSASWTPAAVSPAANQFLVRARMGNPLPAAYVTLSSAPAQLTNSLTKATDHLVEIEFSTPTQIASASANVQQEMVLVLTATAN